MDDDMFVHILELVPAPEITEVLPPPHIEPEKEKV